MWLVIGYGNPLRGDDGAGPQLARQLADCLPAEQAKVLIVHQLTPELALEIISPEIQSVLFIDAIRDQSEPVATTSIYPAKIESCGHHLSPHLLLQLAEQLYQRQVPAKLLTILGEDFSFCDQLSENTAAALPIALKAALKTISFSPEKDFSRDARRSSSPP